MVYSLLLKNGTVVDGTGIAAYQADIAISGNRIAKVGNLGSVGAERVIDASGMHVMPGFIDLTNHADVYGTLFLSPMQESLLKQGITTILVGNCGESLAPIVKKESLNELERWTSGFSVPVNWTSTAEYYSNLEKMKIGINVATLIGQETLKRNSKDAREAAYLLEKALEEGAWGMSSNFNFTEWNIASENEILQLLSIVKKYDALYKIHMRDEGKNFLPSVASIVNIARQSRVRTVISHFKAVGREAWNNFGNALNMIKGAQKDGIAVSFDMFPYLRTGSMLVSFLPNWAKTGKNENILKRLANKESYQKIAEELRKYTLHAEKILIASAAEDKLSVGKSLKEISEKLSLSPEETILEILKTNLLRVTVFGKTIKAKNMLSGLKYPNSVVATDGAGYNIDFGLSKDLVHPRTFGAFSRLIKKTSKSAGLSLPQTINKITHLPAKLMGLSDRGVIKEECIADIVVADIGKIGDKSTYKHSYQYSDGVDFLLIGGKLVIDEKILQGARHGNILRHEI